MEKTTENSVDCGSVRTDAPTGYIEIISSAVDDWYKIGEKYPVFNNLKEKEELNSSYLTAPFCIPAYDCALISKREFDEKYNYQVVHCKTKEQWDFVQLKLFKQVQNASWFNYEENSCIEFLKNQQWSLFYSRAQNFKIYSFEDWCKKFKHSCITNMDVTLETWLKEMKTKNLTEKELAYCISSSNIKIFNKLKGNGLYSKAKILFAELNCLPVINEKDLLLKEANDRYPVGVIYKPLDEDGTSNYINNYTSLYDSTWVNNCIDVGMGYVYANGIWAEIVNCKKSVEEVPQKKSVLELYTHVQEMRDSVWNCFESNSLFTKIICEKEAYPVNLTTFDVFRKKKLKKMSYIAEPIETAKELKKVKTINYLINN